MRVLSFLAVGATLATAAPLSLVMTSEAPASWRVGRPAVGMSRTEISQERPSRMGRLCNKMQSGVARIFSFGIGPVIPNADALAVMAAPHAPPHHAMHPPTEGAKPSDELRPFKLSTINLPPIMPIWQQAGIDRLGHDNPIKPVSVEEGAVLHQDQHRHHHVRPYLHYRHGSFLRRVHRALITLGPWEGRAVAFVLGCGIGVLLRMFWVITVLTYRAIRGTTGEQEEEETRGEYEQVVLVPEQMLVAPPAYTDEKVEHQADVKA